MNISSGGHIYFNNDNSTQITAYNPSSVLDQILSLKTANNTWTGENNFLQLNTIDSGNNKTEIRQVGSDLKIVNKQSSGQIYFITGANQSTSRLYSNGNFYTNQITSTQLLSNSVLIDTSFNISKDTNGNYVFANLGPGKATIFKTKQSNNTDGWQLIFEPNGALYGMNNIIAHSVESKAYKFRDPISYTLTNSQIYLSSGKELILDNNNTGSDSTIKLKTYESNGTSHTLILDQFMNMSGVNDVKMSGKFYLNNIVHTPSTEYTITNPNFGGSVKFQNYDSNGTMRYLLIDQFINLSGINDLRCNKLYISGTFFNPNDITSVQTKTRNIYSYATNQTSIEYNYGRMLFLPGASTTI